MLWPLTFENFYVQVPPPGTKRPNSSTHSQKYSVTVTLCSKCTRPLTFQNLVPGSGGGGFFGGGSRPGTNYEKYPTKLFLYSKCPRALTFENLCQVLARPVPVVGA